MSSDNNKDSNEDKDKEISFEKKNQTEKKPNYDNWSTPGDSTKPINWSTPGDGTKPNNNNPSHETDGIV